MFGGKQILSSDTEAASVRFLHYTTYFIGSFGDLLDSFTV